MQCADGLLLTHVVCLSRVIRSTHRFRLSRCL